MESVKRNKDSLHVVKKAEEFNSFLGFFAFMDLHFWKNDIY